MHIGYRVCTCVSCHACRTEELSDPYLDNFLAQQQLNFGLSGLLMVIARTDNSNMVVYQVNRALAGLRLRS